VANRIFRERRGPIPQNVPCKVIISDFSNGANPVFNGVEAFFELAPALLFGELGKRLRRGFRGLLNSPSGEPGFIPPDLAPLEQRHRYQGYDDMTLTALL
jgi:hypothetical protein